MIDFSHSLNTAWERTRVILFKGDGAKWSLIGCSAFLMWMGRGGVTLSNSVPLQNQSSSYQQTFKSTADAQAAFRDAMVHLKDALVSPWTGVVIGVGLLLFLAWLAMLWVGSRGEFMFLDNIVRNRANLSEPWRRYARQGNAWFGVNLGLMIIGYALTFGGIGALLAEAWAWIFDKSTMSSGAVWITVGTLIVWLIVLITFWLFGTLIRCFVVPLYFKQTMTLGQCFGAFFHILGRHPGSVAFFTLISCGLAIVEVAACLIVVIPLFCVLCWASCVPFFGTAVATFVICQAILPVSVYIRCFQLECLAQFGPEYDIWTVDVLPAPLSPPQQPG